MTLASYDEALTQLDENMSWEGSRSKAVLFIESIRYLRFHRPKENAGGGRSFTYDDVRDLYKDAKAFYDATDTTNQAHFVRARVRPISNGE